MRICFFMRLSEKCQFIILFSKNLLLSFKTRSIMDKEVDLLAQLLQENREDVRNAMVKYQDDESPFRMQRMLREYFKNQNKTLQQQIEEEAQLISVIFPDIDVVVLQGLLHDVGEDLVRTKTVLKQLSSKNGLKRNSTSNDDFLIKKQKLILDAKAVAVDVEVAGPSRDSQASASFFPDVNLIERSENAVIETEVSGEEKSDEMFQTLLDIFPDADPDYLHEHYQRFNEPQDFNNFVMDALEKRDYPKVTTTRTQSADQKQDLTKLYTTDFSVASFLQIIPDPSTHFKKNRVKKPWTPECNLYALTVLFNTYDFIKIAAVKKCFGIANNFLDACDMLDQHPKSCHMRKKRLLPAATKNIALLQEIAYKTHYTEIMEVVRNREAQHKQKIAEAKASGLVLTCSCCFDDEIFPEDTFECDRNCTFCKDCIKRSVEVSFGDGKLVFNCLGDCKGQFSMQVLKEVLPPKLFARISDKRQAEEVKAAEIENLEFCPFCDFAAIPAQGNNIFNCLNPECMKDSCRLCNEPSHIPYRCNEVEKDENVKARTFIENKMSEALLKNCLKCKKQYFKDDGCNMIMCSCGAQMCDACGKLVHSYSHFNHNGESNSKRCPLWSDTLRSNEQKLKEVAENAKKEVNTAGELKFDPSVDIPNHFAELLTKRATAPDWNKADNFLNRKEMYKKKTK